MKIKIIISLMFVLAFTSTANAGYVVDGIILDGRLSDKTVTARTICLSGYLFAMASNNAGVHIVQVYKGVTRASSLPIECEDKNAK